MDNFCSQVTANVIKESSGFPNANLEPDISKKSVCCTVEADIINELNSCDNLTSTTQQFQHSPSKVVTFCKDEATKETMKSNADSVETSSDIEKYKKREVGKPQPTLKEIKNKFKAKLFPGKYLPKKKDNPMKKVENYVNSLSIDQVERRSVTPVLDREEDLELADFIRKRNELLSKLDSKDFFAGDEEIIVLDMVQSQDEHIEAAMERREALLRLREEKKNSLKLEGITEEPPQISPKHGLTLPTPEDYEFYLDAKVEQDYPELAATPSSIQPTACNEDGCKQYPNFQDSIRSGHISADRNINVSSSGELLTLPSNLYGGCQEVNVSVSEFESLNSVLPTFENQIASKPDEKMFCRTRVRSFSDSNDEHSSPFTPPVKSDETIVNVENSEPETVTEENLVDVSVREPKKRLNIGSASGYTSKSFDSSSGATNRKKATLSLPTITTSLPEISLQPPTPQAPKPKANNEQVKYDLRVPGYKSKFLTVPGSEDEGNKVLPGRSANDDMFFDESTESSSDEDDAIHKPLALSALSLIPNYGGLKRFGSSFDMSSVGLKTSFDTEENQVMNERESRNNFDSNEQGDEECGSEGKQERDLNHFRYDNIRHINNNFKNNCVIPESSSDVLLKSNASSHDDTTINGNINANTPENEIKVGEYIASKLAMFQGKQDLNAHSNKGYHRKNRDTSGNAKHIFSPVKAKPLRIDPSIFLVGCQNTNKRESGIDNFNRIDLEKYMDNNKYDDYVNRVNISMNFNDNVNGNDNYIKTFHETFPYKSEPNDSVRCSRLQSESSAEESHSEEIRDEETEQNLENCSPFSKRFDQVNI